MSVIQLNLPPDLEQFAIARAKVEGHLNVDAYLMDLLRKLKAKTELETTLLSNMEQLDRGEGRAMSAQDWAQMRAAYCQRHGIADET
jgi:hypothetical protein